MPLHGSVVEKKKHHVFTSGSFSVLTDGKNAKFELPLSVAKWMLLG